MTFSFQTRYILIILVLIIIGCGNQDKEDASNFFLKGNQALTQKNYAEAIRLYDEATDKNPAFSDAFLNKGICLLKLGQANDAYEVLSNAIQVDPSLVQAILVRSEAGLLIGKLNESEEDLKRIKKEYKDSSRYYLVHGNLMESKSNTAEALVDYDMAISLDSSNVEALVNRGAIQYKLGSLNLANQDFAKAVKFNPSQPEALNNLGLIATKQKDWKTAISYFDLILNSNPADPLALNNKGFVLLNTGDLEKAREVIERSLDVMPNNGYALRNLGIYYKQKGNYSQALLEFNKAIELAEIVEDLYGLTGQAHLLSGNKAAACKLWSQGIILKDPLAKSEYETNCK